MRASSVVIAVSLMGCVSYRASAVVAATGGVAATAGAVFVGARSSDPAFDTEVATFMLVGTPVLVGVLGLIGMGVHAALDKRKPRPTERSADDDSAGQAAANARARQERAWQLTLRAQASARQGDCGEVRLLDVEVRTLDSELHAMAFARDVAILRCLAAPVEPSP